jgi:hypothetical protein
MRFREAARADPVCHMHVRDMSHRGGRVRHRYNPGANFNLSPSRVGRGETLMDSPGGVPNRAGR